MSAVVELCGYRLDAGRAWTWFRQLPPGEQASVFGALCAMRPDAFERAAQVHGEIAVRERELFPPPPH